MFETIEMKNPPTEISFHPDFKAHCKIGGKIFHGDCYITYCPTKDTLIEFESFEDWLGKEMMRESITIEEAAYRIYCAMVAALGDIPLQVTVSARTTVHAPVEAHYSNAKWRERCGNTRGVL